MNRENGDEPGLLDTLANKWKTASKRKKVMWLAIAMLAAYLAYRLKQNWDKVRAARKNHPK
jgi:hypothetical protein